MKTKIGNMSFLENLPMKITIDDEPYILSETNNEIYGHITTKKASEA